MRRGVIGEALGGALSKSLLGGFDTRQLGASAEINHPGPVKIRLGQQVIAVRATAVLYRVDLDGTFFITNRFKEVILGFSGIADSEPSRLVAYLRSRSPRRLNGKDGWLGCLSLGTRETERSCNAENTHH